MKASCSWVLALVLACGCGGTAGPGRSHAAAGPDGGAEVAPEASVDDALSAPDAALDEGAEASWSDAPDDASLDAQPDVPSSCQEAGTSGCAVGCPCLSNDGCATGTFGWYQSIACVCQTTASLPDGTPCSPGGDGGAGVCTNGVCDPCTPGGLCVPLANPCDVGQLTCSGGTVCVDTHKPDRTRNGTPCGFNQVCDDGACVACTAGLSCTPANPCHVGVTSCTTGQSVCADAGDPLPDGTLCNGSMVCEGGACVSCTSGAACALPNPCHAGALDCSGVTPVCQDLGPRPDESTCGSGSVCCGDSCVAETANCGRCGHDCQGGACAGGACQAFVVAPATEPYCVAVDSTGIYFTMNTAPGLLLKVAGGSYIQLSYGGNPAYLALDDTYVYWTDAANGDVNKVNKAVGPQQTLATGTWRGAGAIAVDSTNVYWAAPGAIESVGLDGGVATSLFATSDPRGIALDATNVYWTWWSGGVGQGPLGGGSATTLATTSDAWGVAVDAANVYWSDASGIVREPIGGGSATTLAAGLWGPVTRDAISLFVAATSGVVASVPLAGGSVTTLWSGAGGAPACIANDATAVYWPGAGGIMKVVKP